ncbi:MAG: hypothetical protein IJ989_02905 [Paludibacteraceae bacterium]|nr:hypothetical protein [Paludibacteraceae bacterium]
MKKIFTLFAALACVMSMSAVTYNVTVPAGTKACYIAGEMNSWSFTEMTKVDDTHYTVTLAEATEAMGYKYCSGPGWAYVEKTEGGEEIGNRVYAVKDVVAKWASVYDPGNAPTPGEAKDITIKAKVPATWTNTITAWVWPTGGEGKEVTPTKEGEWYIYTQNCAELNIIFKNGTGWNGDINQTVDITISESTCVEITAGTGKATYTIVDCEDNPGEEPGDDPVVDPETGVTYTVTVPAGTKACYIAGEMNGWSQQEMTKVDETHYTITIATATTAMKYKYCSGPDWAYVEMQADGTTDVQDRTYAANDVVEAWKAVYDPAGEDPGDDPVVDPETGVTYNVTVPAGTKACYIAGEMNGWSQQEMTKVDDTHYTITIATATTAMKYKYCSGPSWDYVEMQADGVTDVQDRTYSANDVVESWKAVYDPNGSENPDPNPEPKDIMVKAKMPSHWTETITAWVWETGKEGEVVVPTKDNDWYVVSAHCSALNVIFRNGTDWNGDANQTVNITLMDSACIVLSQSDTTKATYTIVDCETSEPLPEPKGVTYSVTVPAGTNACYIAGEMNGWSHTEMTKVDDTHYTLTVDTATASMKYKYCSGPSWDYVEKTVAGGDVADRVYSANDVVEAWAAVYDPTSTPIDPAQITYVLMGVKGDWANGIAMIKNESAESEEYMLIGQTIAEGDSVKVVRLENGEAKHWCGNVKEGVTVTITPDDKNGNIILAPGSYDFYYDVAADAIWIAVSTHSAIDNVAVENRAVKIIRNGQMFILRDGMMYNIVGQIAE